MLIPDLKMPINKDMMITKKDVYFPPPLKYPGKRTRNNKNGTLMNKIDWKKNEVKKWIMEMRKNDKYDHSYHSVKAEVLSGWLTKTFPNTSIKEAKALLFDCDNNEEENSKYDNEDNERSETEDVDDDEIIDAELIDPVEEQNVANESPDMFESDSDNMEIDEDLNRTEKEAIIHSYSSNFDKKYY